MRPKSEDFQVELNRIFANSSKLESPYIIVRSGDLHRAVGGYPGKNHMMPTCCSVMRRNMKPFDEIIEQPPKGNGANLYIKFLLDR